MELRRNRKGWLFWRPLWAARLAMLACAGATAPWSADDGVATKLCTRSNRSWRGELTMVSSNWMYLVKPPKKKRWLNRFYQVLSCQCFVSLSPPILSASASEAVWTSWGGSYLLQTATAAIKASESVSWRQGRTTIFLDLFSPRQARFFVSKSEALEVVIDSPSSTSTPAWNSGAGIAWCIVWHWKGIRNCSDLQFSDVSFFWMVVRDQVTNDPNSGYL